MKTAIKARQLLELLQQSNTPIPTEQLAQKGFNRALIYRLRRDGNQIVTHHDSHGCRSYLLLPPVASEGGTV